MTRLARIGAFLVVLVACHSTPPSTDAGGGEEALHDAGPYDAGTIPLEDGGEWSEPEPTTTEGDLTLLVESEVLPTAMAVQGDSLYWVDSVPASYGGAVRTMSTTTGMLPTSIAATANIPIAIAADETSVYWVEYGTFSANAADAGYYCESCTTDSDCGPADAGNHCACANQGCTINFCVTGCTGPSDTNCPAGAICYDLSSTSEPIYDCVPETGSCNSGAYAFPPPDVIGETYNDDGAVLKAPLDGGTAVTLASGQIAPAGLVVDGTYAYWTTQGTGTTTGAIVKVPLAGGSVTTLADAQPSPDAIAIDADHVYWVNSGDGSIHQAALDGTAAMTLATAQQSPVYIAVDSSHVYWANLGPLDSSGSPKPSSGSIGEVPIGGGGVTTRAGFQDLPYWVGTSGGYVYWVNMGSELGAGSVNRVLASGGTVDVLVGTLETPMFAVLTDTGFLWSEVGEENGDEAIFQFTASQ